MIIARQFRPLLKAIGLVVLVITGKTIVHFMEWEMLSINPLLSGIVAANVFILGFLLSGVMSDFRESERLPGELAAALENLAQEVMGVKMARADANITPCLTLISGIFTGLLDWFYKRQRTTALLEQLNHLTPQFALMEQWTQGTLLGRLKQEQSNLRRSIIRIHTIRETSFVSSGYVLADIITLLLCCGLVLVKIEPFHESLFFVAVISFVMIFLLILIRDLDNPFGYYEQTSGEDVSLKPIEDAARRLAEAINGEALETPTHTTAAAQPTA